MARPELDPYDVLGVPRHASAAEIARAYRRAARETHPDSRPDDPSAAERFRELAAAYEILGDARRRAAYDRAHPGARVVVQRRVSHGPPPVPLGRRRAGQAEPIDLTGGRRRASAPPFGSPAAPFEDELLRLAATLVRRLRGGWL